MDIGFFDVVLNAQNNAGNPFLLSINSKNVYKMRLNYINCQNNIANNTQIA